MTDKQMVWREEYPFAETLEDLIIAAKRMCEKYGLEYNPKDIMLKADEHSLAIFSQETEKEKEARLKKEDNLRRRLEDDERRELARLKAKYDVPAHLGGTP